MISELVNAAKDMVIAATATQTPLSAGDVCAVGCEPRSGFRATLDICLCYQFPFRITPACSVAHTSRQQVQVQPSLA